MRWALFCCIHFLIALDRVLSPATYTYVYAHVLESVDPRPPDLKRIIYASSLCKLLAYMKPYKAHTYTHARTAFDNHSYNITMQLLAVSFRSLRFALCILAAILTKSASNDLEGLDLIYPTNLTAGDGRIPLTLGLMVSFSGSFVIKGAIPGIQLAVDIVNGGGILPGYRLQYSLTDSKV